MKLKNHVLPLFIVTCATVAFGPDDLDIAIRDASNYLNDNIPQGNKVVIINIQSDYAALSEYIIEELIANAVNDKMFSVVDRAQLEQIRMELNFQLSGEVSDDSALEIGRFLGAQTIVSGAISELGDRHRIRIRALNVETAEVQGQYNRNINPSRTIAALMRGGSTQTANYGTTTPRTSRDDTSGQTTQAQTTPTTPATTTSPATTARPTGPANGTYTFYPRLQPYMGATKHDRVYLWKIVVRGEYMSIFLTNSAVGGTTNSLNNDWYGGGNNQSTYILQDLDNPSRSWNPEIGRISGYSWGEEGFWFTFKGVTATRFSFANAYLHTPSVFEEIDLSKAEYEP
jgi:TolB-like protein